MKIQELVVILSVGLSWAILGCAPPEAGRACEADQVGLLSCSRTSEELLLCKVNPDRQPGEAHYQWEPEVDCAIAGEICVDPREELGHCACEPTATRCWDGGTTVEICNPEEEWEVSETCSEGTICEVQEDGAVCVPGTCKNRATRCSSDNSQVETCSDAQWTVTATCNEDQVCRVVGDSAQCVDVCTNGATRCSSDNSQVETCSDAGWTVTATCTQDQACRVVGDSAQCVAADDSCTADKEYDQRCNPDDDIWIQECRNVGTAETPKYEWRDLVDCSLGSADEVCVDDPNMSLPICGLPPT